MAHIQTKAAASERKKFFAFAGLTTNKMFRWTDFYQRTWQHIDWMKSSTATTTTTTAAHKVSYWPRAQANAAENAGQHSIGCVFIMHRDARLRNRKVLQRKIMYIIIIINEMYRAPISTQKQKKTFSIAALWRAMNATILFSSPLLRLFCFNTRTDLFFLFFRRRPPSTTLCLAQT